MKNWFTEHPRSVNETYWEHLCFSIKTALLFFAAGFAAITHAIFPFLCVITCSNIVSKLAAGYCKGKRRGSFLMRLNQELAQYEQCIIKQD